MFGKKKEEVPTPVPKPLPKSSPKQIEAVEVEEVPEYEENEESEENVEYGDSGEQSEGLTEEVVVTYLKNFEQRLNSIEATLFRLKNL
ncbi:MAG: hypothetical protein M0R17_09440 [Candidatus Omnitrophica bacterium]|jgi:hypothetical protein|nr:hypothetical protein [Candidatus Omnitrophota bacterium]